MNRKQISYCGGICFFVGLLLILISWHFTYPISMAESEEVLFTQFFPSIWPGIVISLIGLFLAGYYSERKGIKAICASLFPLLLYSYVYYFSYVPTSDGGVAKAMFEIFHQTGINPTIESYFHYPIYFTLNEMAGQFLGLGADGLAAIFFTIFGSLIAVYLYLFFSKHTRRISHGVAFLVVPLYFLAIFTYLNYQWVPQTLALVLFILLLILFDRKENVYKSLSIVVFTALVFTHVFIPVIFLLFLGLSSFKKKEFRNSFLLTTSIYVLVLMYYATFYLPGIIDAFRQTIYGFGEEYAINLSRSFMEPEGSIDQLISMVNRMRIPLIWIVLSVGLFFSFIKRKLDYQVILLGMTGGFYFGVGLFYSVLGTRALQVLCISLVAGVGFFITRWKKPTLVFISILLILSVSGPMRSAYDTYLFQQGEEEDACNFLASTLPTEQPTKLGMGGINFGYFTKKHEYLCREVNTSSVWVVVPENPEFYTVFNVSMGEHMGILYNPSLEKEIASFGLEMTRIDEIKGQMLLHNKIYVCGKTFVVTSQQTLD